MIDKVREQYRIDLWSYEDFLAFVLMYAAYADNEVVEDELDAIIEKVGRDREVKARKIIEKLNDKERLDLILSFREKYFPTKEDHDKLFQDMQTIFLADGEFNVLERAVLLYLKRIL